MTTGYENIPPWAQPWEQTFEPAPSPFTKGVYALGYDPYNTVDAHAQFYQTRWALMTKGLYHARY